VLCEGRQIVGSQCLSKSLRRCSSVEPMALMAPLQVVALQEPVEISLDFGRLDVSGRRARHPEALIQQCVVHPFDEAVGSGGANSSGAML